MFLLAIRAKLRFFFAEFSKNYWLVFVFGTETDARVGSEKWTTEETGFVRNEKQKPRACKLTVMLFDSHKSQPQFALKQKTYSIIHLHHSFNYIYLYYQTIKIRNL